MNNIMQLAAFIFIICCSACSDNQKAQNKATIGNIALPSVSPTVNGDKVVIDTKRSTISWRGTKLAGIRGHEGTLGLTEGFLIFNNDSLLGGRIIADMNAIGITDIPVHEHVAIRNLTKHLKIDFESTKYPTAKFEISKVEHLTAETVMISGIMTIKNISRQISVPARVEKPSESPEFSTTFRLNRFDYNIGTEGSWLEKRLVDEEFELNIKLQLL